MYVCAMSANFIVQRQEMPNVNSVMDEVEKYCKQIVESERTIMFIPKDGFLATLGLFFTEKAISYHLEFKKDYQ